MKIIEQDRIKTITEYHRVTGLPKPEHPLISVVNMDSLDKGVITEPISSRFDFYCISLQTDLNAQLKYGRQSCDFCDGVMLFRSPGQSWGLDFEKDPLKRQSGLMILIHPDFLWNTTLANTIKQAEFFNYSPNEALHLSEKEKMIITGIIKYIEQEYHANIDKFSQKIIVAQLAVILTYANRFYQRQFITRKISSHHIINRVKDILTEYFQGDILTQQGLPTVAYVADQLNITPGYLSELLKTITGQSTQQYIHDKLIEKAKEKLADGVLSVKEIAFQLGFEHIQSFSKLFKAKTMLSPWQFRQLYN